MKSEARVLQDRIEFRALRWCRIDAQERIGGEQHEGEEAQRDEGLDREHARLKPRGQIVAEGRHGCAVDGEDGDPEQQ
jgi:hypothetical protein